MKNKKDNLKDFIQFLKYGAIGSVNEILDISILNFLSYITGITKGPRLIFFNIISFCFYSTNSYFLNKKFTFNKLGSKKPSYLKYTSVLFFSMILSTVILLVLSCNNLLLLLPIHNISIHKLNVIWLNVSKITASMTGGIIGFLTAKFFIFDKNIA